jgi:GT2 family glycosyltransferase
MNFSVVIPTYNREKDLLGCVESVVRQAILPNEIIIIDDGNLPMEFVDSIKTIFNNSKTSFRYYKKEHFNEPRGLSESKNIGLKIASNEILFILDDDLILEGDFFKEIIMVWQENKDDKLIGVAGIIKNNRKKSMVERIYNKIFGLTSKYSWDVNSVGFQVWNDGIQKKEKGYYAHGGVCSYSKNLAQKLIFTTFSGGRTALEDVDFCLRAKNRGYYFIIEPKARVLHKQSPASKEKNFLIGFKESYNRKIIFKNNCRKSIRNFFWFYWANIGWILRQFLVGHFSKGAGMIKGLFVKTK